MSELSTTADMMGLVRDFTSYLLEVRMSSHTTTRRYTSIISEFAEFLEAGGRRGENGNGAAYRLENVTKRVLVEFLRQNRSGSDQPSRSTWNIQLAALRAFFDFLFKTERVRENPALKIDRLKIQSREPIPLTLDEFLTLVETMETASRAYRARNVAIIELFFHTALRVAEMASLDVEQVDFDNRLLLNVRTKGDKFISLPFNDLVSEALERYLEDREKRAGNSHVAALFLSNRGKRMSVRTIQSLVKEYGARAGIGRTVTPHLLRHSSATELTELGVPTRVIQDICGHEQITTTQRYTHVRQATRRRAIAALGRAVKQRRRERHRERHSPGGSHLTPE